MDVVYSFKQFCSIWLSYLNIVSINKDVVARDCSNPVDVDDEGPMASVEHVFWKVGGELVNRNVYVEYFLGCIYLAVVPVGSDVRYVLVSDLHKHPVFLDEYVFLVAHFLPVLFCCL